MCCSAKRAIRDELTKPLVETSALWPRIATPIRNDIRLAAPRSRSYKLTNEFVITLNVHLARALHRGYIVKDRLLN